MSFTLRCIFKELTLITSKVKSLKVKSNVVYAYVKGMWQLLSFSSFNVEISN